MASLTEVVEYCDTLLDISAYQDYCPNGLQVEGSGEVRRIVSGVTASQALIDRAVELDADLLLVHHGYFWKGEPAPITGIRRRRIKTLLEHNISLLAYHLPLDDHDSLGNNVQLARLWGFSVEGRFGSGENGGLGRYATLELPLSAADMGERLGRLLQRKPLIIHGGNHPIRRLGWCSGAAQGMIDAAAAAGLDAFVSGEVSEPTVHAARELGIHYFAAGHHATERYGVKSLGEHLAGHFLLENHFVDIANPA